MFSLEEIIKEICSHSGKNEEDVKKLIKEKQDELSGLVSDEGAAYIVGRELDVNLLQESIRQLNVKNLVSGMRSVDLIGKVVRIFEPRNWEKDGKSGSVANLLIADETGVVRLSLWNQEVDLVRNKKIKEEDVVRIKGGYVKNDYKNEPELRVGKGSIEVVEEEVNVPDTAQSPNQPRIKINDFKEGQGAEVRGCIVQVYKRNPFYKVCSECGGKITEEGEKFKCNDHGEVAPKPCLVLSCVIDDGYGNIRAVFFRDIAEKIAGMKTEELVKIGGDPLLIYDHIKIIGKEFVIKGRVRRNNFTEEIELVGNDASEVDIEKECNTIIQNLGKN